MLCLFFVCLFYVCDLIKKRHHPYISLLSWLHPPSSNESRGGETPLIKCFLSLALRSHLTKDVLSDNGVSGRAVGPDPWPPASPEDRCLNTDNYCEPDAPLGRGEKYCPRDPKLSTLVGAVLKIPANVNFFMDWIILTFIFWSDLLCLGRSELEYSNWNNYHFNDWLKYFFVLSIIDIIL